MEKNIKLVGSIWPGGDKTIKIQMDENDNFTNEQSELEDWAYCLNTPWSDTSMHYNVHPDYQNTGRWIAEKTVIVYDSIDASIIACGDTPQDAITNCDKFFEEIKTKYYKEEE